MTDATRDERPNPDDELDIYVPAAWTCPACHCGLAQATISAATGEIGITSADIARTPACPNDCGPMLRVRWRDRALEAEAAHVRDMERLMAATGTDNWPAAFDAVEELREPSASPERSRLARAPREDGPMTEEYYPHPNKGQPELHVYGSDEDGWQVWLNTGIADHDGLVIGTGDTRQAAVTAAVIVAEWIEAALQRPAPPRDDLIRLQKIETRAWSRSILRPHGRTDR